MVYANLIQRILDIVWMIMIRSNLLMFECRNTQGYKLFVTMEVQGNKQLVMW